MASGPEHRHLDAVVKRAEDLEFDKRHPTLMQALRDHKRRTNELLKMDGYGSAAGSVMKDKYIPGAEILERELRAFLENPE